MDESLPVFEPEEIDIKKQWANYKNTPYLTYKPFPLSKGETNQIPSDDDVTFAVGCGVAPLIAGLL